MPRSPFDVCLVGLGPVGATLAARLGTSGVRTVVLERETAPYSLPRAAHLDGEALRILASVRVHPKGRELDGFDLVTARGGLLLRGRPIEGPPEGFPAGRLIHQPSVERALRQRLAASPNVDVRLGAEVVGISPEATGAAVETTSGESVRAALVVGCDGAWSTVRDAMGVGLTGSGFEQRWLVVDTILRQRPDALGLPERLLQIAAPHRPTTYVPFADPRRRWEFRLRPGETPEALTQPETIRRLLAPHVPPEAVEIERAAVYTFHDLVARRWRQGRLLLAGDAAHQMPPFLGQGLGAGLRDADTLA
ncbi:MAG: FAD-dependent monooxygenase, partial [Bacteroidota bacterium]